jgi:hypothetical protein
MEVIMRYTLSMVLLVVLVGCNGAEGKRVAGATLMGSALGVSGGPIGVAVGATLGAAAGVLLPPEMFKESNANTHTTASAEKPAP